MDKKKEFLAIIPARAGSSRIPNKNMKLVGNKPMIQHTIEAAISSLGVNNIIISTNDKKVIKLSNKLGVRPPFVRPKKLSTKTATTVDVILHSMEWYKNNKGFLPSNIILLQPTSPLRSSKDISNSIRKFNSSKKKTLVSVCKPMQHPNDFLFKYKEKYKTLNFFTSMNYKKLKEVNEPFFIDGSIYISDLNHFIKKNDLIGDDPEIFLMPQTRAIDVDKPFDLDLARMFYKSKKK